MTSLLKINIFSDCISTKKKHRVDECDLWARCNVQNRVKITETPKLGQNVIGLLYCQVLKIQNMHQTLAIGPIATKRF